MYEEESKDGYLGIFRGVLKNLRKRWCVLHESTFMWFKAKQDFIHAGYLTKMGGGTSTLGRKVRAGGGAVDGGVRLVGGCGWWMWGG